MFRSKQTKQQKKLNKLIKKYVKKGYRVQDKGDDFASLYKPAMSTLGRLTRGSVQLATIGMAGHDHEPDRHLTIYIFVDSGGRTSITKGKAKV